MEASAALRARAFGVLQAVQAESVVATSALIKSLKKLSLSERVNVGGHALPVETPLTVCSDVNVLSFYHTTTIGDSSFKYLLRIGNIKSSMGKKNNEKEIVEESKQEEYIKLDWRKTTTVALISISVILFLSSVFYFLPGKNPSPMDRIKTILLFVLISYGMGYTILSSMKKSLDSLEKHFMTLGIGLSVLPIMTLILNMMGLPLDATLLLIVSLAYPLYSLLIRPRKTGTDKHASTGLLENKNTLALAVVLLLASMYLFVLLQGSLVMPYLEDDDPWEHAVGAKYISVVKDYSLPEDVGVAHYLEPYPPTYDGLMGILHQYNSSVQWTLKFFNALLVGLSIVLAYYFIRLFTGDEKIAVGGAFILTFVPCYLSHFIWAHVLGHVLFYPTLYAVEMVGGDRKWMLPAVLAVASITVSQPMVSLVFGLFYASYYITRVAYSRRLLKEVLVVGALGLLVSIMFFWGPVILKYGTGFEKIDATGRRIQSGEFKIAFEERVIPLDEILLVSSFDGDQPAGCALLIPGKYCIPLSGNIAIQKGFGVVVSLLFVLSAVLLMVYFKKESGGGSYWVPVSLVWSILMFIGLESWALPVSVDPPRFFMFLTLPMAIVVPKGVLMLTDLLRRYVKPEYVIAVLVIAVLYTSAYPKYEVQTAVWPYGVMWNNPEQLQGYLALKEILPPESTVFPMCMEDKTVIGLDKLSYAWDKEVLDFRETILDRDAIEIHDFLRNKGYEYMVLDTSCILKCSEGGDEIESCAEQINKIAVEIQNSGKYSPKWSNNAVLLYKIL